MPEDFFAFRRFLKAAKGGSQEDIIIEFLASTVLNDPVSDHGSVLINHPQRKVLITFNEGDFLFEKKLLDPKARGSWPPEIGYYDNIAGICFRTEETQTYCRAKDIIPAEAALEPEWQKRLGWLEQRLAGLTNPGGVSPC